MSPRPLGKRLFYIGMRYVFRLAAVVMFGFRCSGRHHEPRDGAVLVCSNHQSFLDPAVVGLNFQRRLNFLARDTLFRIPLLGGLIGYLDAIPLEREGLGLAGLKESLRRIKRGEMVLIFPEGTRTVDGEVAALKPGFCMLARRGNVSLLPVGVDGAYDAWPRSARLPRPSTIRVVIGERLTPEFVQRVDDDHLVAELERRIRDCQAQARAARFR